MILTALLIGHWSILWPLIIFPAFAGWISHLAAVRLPHTRADWRVAAALAALPGAVTVALTLKAWFRTAELALCPDCDVSAVAYVASGIGAAFVTYAAVRAIRRHRALSKILSAAVEPSPELVKNATAAGVRILELPCSEKVMFAAGFFRPVVVVSTGTLACLSPDELRAALSHERAHVEGKDPAILTVLSIFHDLAPTSASALQAYQQTRERAADQAAIKAAGALPLAAALLALIKGEAAPAQAVPMLNAADGAWRLRAILEIERPPHLATSSAAFLGIVANLAFAFWPIEKLAVLYLLQA